MTVESTCITLVETPELSEPSPQSSRTLLIADLVLIIGTSLVVYPFASLPEYARPSVPRVVMNLDALDDFERPNDVHLLGDCDQTIWTLCERLGWLDDLQTLHTQIDGVPHRFGVVPEEKKLETRETVDALARELAEELKLDKEEDVEIRKVREKVLKSDTWDDDAVIVTKRDAEDPKPDGQKAEKPKAEEAKDDEARGEQIGPSSKTEDKTPPDPKEKL